MAKPAVTAAVFGESLVDIWHTSETRVVRPGGSPLNVAVGLARLGAEVEFATVFGRDDHGELIRRHLDTAGVRVIQASNDGQSTSVAEATIGDEGGAEYRFDIRWAPKASPTGVVDVGHIGSISSVLMPGAAHVLEWVEGLPPGTTVSFDPNIRPSITGSQQETLDAVNRAASRSDIIKVSVEDLDHLGDRQLPKRWLEGRPTLVVVTDGGAGAELLTAEGQIHVPAKRLTVADTIGAGDSFMAGLLYSLGAAVLLDRDVLQKARLSELVGHGEFASTCAAITVSRPGADPPDLPEVQRFTMSDGRDS